MGSANTVRKLSSPQKPLIRPNRDTAWTDWYTML